MKRSATVETAEAKPNCAPVPGSAPGWTAEDEAAFRVETEKCQREHLEYIKRGVCSQCGATCAKEAEGRCTQQRMVNDEYTCAGEDLWEHEDEAQSARPLCDAPHRQDDSTH